MATEILLLRDSSVEEERCLRGNLGRMNAYLTPQSSHNIEADAGRM